MAITDEDISAAALIALTVIVIAAVARARVTPHALAGHWMSQSTGAMYEITPGPGGSFAVRGDEGMSGTGRIKMLRGLRLGPARGSVDLMHRQITWRRKPDGEDVWIFQGIR